MQPDSHCGIENGFGGKGLEAGKPSGFLMHTQTQAEAEGGLAEGGRESQVEAFQRHAEAGGHRTWGRSHVGQKGERSWEKAQLSDLVTRWTVMPVREKQGADGMVALRGAGKGVLGQREDGESSYSPRPQCFSKLSGMSPLLSGP